MKTRAKKCGFTLVEMMISVVSAAILSLTVILILFMTYREWRTNNEYAQLRRDAALAVEMMSREVRETTFADIIAVEPTLVLPANAVRPYAITFQQNPFNSTLHYFTNGVFAGLIIPEGVGRFNPMAVNNGVRLHLELANADGSIIVTNETFIRTRN